MTMAGVLFSGYYKSVFRFCDHRFHHYRGAGKERMFIFLLIGACVSVAALLWFGRVLWRHRKSGGQISVLIITLILSDLLEVFLDPYIVVKLLQDENCWDTSMTCRILASLWSAARNYGLHLNVLVVLESVLSIRHPYCSALVFFPSCSIVFSIIAFICIFLCEFFYLPPLYLLSVSLLLALTIMTCFVTCRTPPQTDETSYSSRRPDSTVLGFVVFIVVPYMVYYVLCFFLWRFWDLHVMGNCLMSLRVVSDPFLCMLVYWKNLSQKPLTHKSQPSTEMTDDPETHGSAI